MNPSEKNYINQPMNNYFFILEAVLKNLLDLKFFVGTKCSILKILCVFLRLNTWSRLDFKPEKGF